MVLTDIFGQALVIGHGPCAGRVDLDDTCGTRAALVGAAARCQALGAPGLLLLAAGHDLYRMSANDALVERLESRGWDLLYLTHDRALDAADDDADDATTRRAWYRCETLPHQVWALAIGLPLLQRWVALPTLAPAARSAPLWLGQWARQAATTFARPGTTLVACPAFAPPALGVVRHHRAVA